MDDATEVWVPINGYEGYYEVSDLGRVRSLDRWITTFDGRSGRIVRGQIMAQSVSPQGYMQVNLFRDGRPSTYRIHRLVADAFLGPRPVGMEILHGPAGRRVNAVSNLSFGTSAQNSADMERDGTTRKGTAVYIAKLTEDIVRTCRVRYMAGGVTVQSLADEFGVSMQTMWDAIHRRTWKHVTA